MDSSRDEACPGASTRAYQRNAWIVVRAANGPSARQHRTATRTYQRSRDDWMSHDPARLLPGLRSECGTWRQSRTRTPNRRVQRAFIKT